MHHQYFVVAPLLSFLASVIAQENPFACESCLTTSTLGIASNAVVEHSSAIPAFSHDASLAHRKAKIPKPKVSLTTPVEATETIAHAPLKSTATKAIAILTSIEGIATGSIAIPTPSMGKDGHEDSATVTSTTTTADPTGSDKQPIEPTWKPKWWGGDHSLKLLGCYNETDEEGEFVMTSKYGGDSAKKGGMNLGTCRQHCKAVKYFGVSNGDDCICADYFKSSMYKVNGTLCNVRCIGVGEYACGGNGYMNIYQKTTMKNDLNSMTNSSTNNLVDLDWTFFFGVLFMTFYLTSLRRNW